MSAFPIWKASAGFFSLSYFHVSSQLRNKKENVKESA